MKGFLDYIPGNSILHRLNPLTKLILSVLICIACFLTDSHFFLIGLICLNIFLGILGGVFKTALRILKGLLKISILLFVLQIFFVRSGNIIVRFPFNIYITDSGILFSLLVVLKLICATMPLALMLSITQMSDLSNVFVSMLGIPYKYAFTFTSAVRFVPIFASEMSEIIESQTARGVSLDTRNIFKKIKLVLPLCVPLLVTCVKKNEASALSAEIRGFHLRTKQSCYKKYCMRISDYSFLLFAVIILTCGIQL